jgi:hypothetical protein
VADFLNEAELRTPVQSSASDTECTPQVNQAGSCIAASGSDENTGKDSAWSRSEHSASTGAISVQETEHKDHLQHQERRHRKVIYLTTDGKAVQPEENMPARQSLQLCTVPEDHQLSRDQRWNNLRDHVRLSLIVDLLYC